MKKIKEVETLEKEEKPVEIINLDNFEENIIACACKSGDDLPFKR